jgi:hypothetical protein
VKDETIRINNVEYEDDKGQVYKCDASIEYWHEEYFGVQYEVCLSNVRLSQGQDGLPDAIAEKLEILAYNKAEDNAKDRAYHMGWR